MTSTSRLRLLPSAWMLIVLVTLTGLTAGAYNLAQYGDPCSRDRAAEEHILPTPAPVTESGAEGATGSAPEGSSTGLRLTDVEPFRSSQSWRFGVGVPGGAKGAEWVPRLGAGWWISWGVFTAEVSSESVEFWQMVRLRRGESVPSVWVISRAARKRPGQVWIIGNEPDVKWQDNVTPACYATQYHDAYRTIKRADPTAQVAVAGVAQGTPLRLAYLDAVLQAYQARYGQPMPVDTWTLHAFVLPEVRGGWGVDIPPGIPADAGVLHGIQEHDDLAAFKSQIVAFRRWMAARGYRDRPLAITEYGILMPEAYGFDDERVRRFMFASFDFFLSARDSELGYSTDEYRLVQHWAWFSLDYDLYPTGNLIDPRNSTLTTLGRAYREYVVALP